MESPRSCVGFFTRFGLVADVAAGADIDPVVMRGSLEEAIER